jgi:hypothetical protein
VSTAADNVPQPDSSAHTVDALTACNDLERLSDRPGARHVGDDIAIAATRAQTAAALAVAAATREVAEMLARIHDRLGGE